jgi:AAA domain
MRDPAQDEMAKIGRRIEQAKRGKRAKQQTNGADVGETPLAIKTSAEFVAGFVPPDYVVDGLLQQAFLYSLTGATGAGKTSIALRLAASVALGISLAGRETKKARVLYVAAENPDDVRMKWIALAPHMDFDPSAIEVFFTDRRFTISKMIPVLRAELERLGGGFGLVIIDTGPSFFEGDDESSRSQMGAHARMFRDLIDVIPGRPCIIVNCHPVKNAAADNLLPAGGGTFLNEMDGNLTTAKTESTVELHWQGKFRGVEFAAMNFIIRTITHPDLKDSKGRLIPTCMAEFISEAAREDIAKAKIADETKVLELINFNPALTFAGIAVAMNWKLHNGEPNKMRAKRCVDSVKKDKLVKATRSGRWQITSEGKKALNSGTGEMEAHDAS